MRLAGVILAALVVELPPHPKLSTTNPPPVYSAPPNPFQWQPAPAGVGRLQSNDIDGRSKSWWMKWTNGTIVTFAPVTNTILNTNVIAFRWDQANYSLTEFGAAQLRQAATTERWQTNAAK